MEYVEHFKYFKIWELWLLMNYTCIIQKNCHSYCCLFYILYANIKREFIFLNALIRWTEKRHQMKASSALCALQAGSTVPERRYSRPCSGKRLGARQLS